MPYTLSEYRQFDVTAGEILEKITERTRLLILNSPQNPTGGVTSASVSRPTDLPAPLVASIAADSGAGSLRLTEHR